MSFNGSGTFLINTAGQPVVSGTVISSTAFNALTADLATGLSTAITKDGQTTVTANIPMSTYKFTGLGVGSAATDSANLSQVQSTVTKLLNSVSGADTITATASPTLAAYAAGQMFYFVAAGDNTTSVTLNIDSLGAKAVTRDGSTALAAADIKSGEVIVVVYDGTRFQVVSQLNSAGDARFANVSIASSLYVGGVSTFVGNAGFSANVSIASALSVGGVAAITGATTIGGNLTLSGGNLAFTSTAQRITADFSNATLANRLMFQTSTTNSNTNLGVLPNGSGVQTQFSFFGSSDSANSSRLRVGTDNSSAFIVSDVTGTGTNLPLTFTVGGSQRAVIDTSGNLGIGTASPAYRLDVQGASGVGMQIFETSTGNNNRLIITQTGTISRFTSTYSSGSGNFAWNIGGSEFMRLDSSGNLGIGTASPGSYLSGTAKLVAYANANSQNNILVRNDSNGASSSAALVLNASGNTWGIEIGSSAKNSNALTFQLDYGITNSTKMTLDSSGNLGLGVTPSAWLSSFRALQISAGFSVFGVTSDVDNVGMTANAVFDATDARWEYLGTGHATLYQHDAGKHMWSNAPSGTAGNTISFTQAMTLTAAGSLGLGTASPTERLDVVGGGLGVGNGTIKTVISYTTEGLVGTVSNHALLLYANNAERARITSGGDLLVGVTTGSYHILRKAVTNDGGNTTVEFQSTGGSTSQIWYGVSGFNANAANAATKVGRDATTLRSINAGGTVNASGADYAEYMTKAGDFALAKGDVCGINADGKLTNVFANAISFVVKSTDPSYVGGDSWGAEFKDDPEGLEAARQKVDRIAFAGQVPVNVLGATPGQYIVPINDNGAIKGVAVSNPTFEQYQSAVGKVIAVQDDGRALIIVKVA